MSSTKPDENIDSAAVYLGHLRNLSALLTLVILIDTNGIYSNVSSVQVFPQLADRRKEARLHLQSPPIANNNSLIMRVEFVFLLPHLLFFRVPIHDGPMVIPHIRECSMV